MAKVDVHAIFIDVMGFADSILHLGEREQSQLEKNLRHTIMDPESSAAVLALASRYRTFHETIREELDLNESTVDFVMTFSDSAYILTERFETAARIAFGVMRRCLFSDIPLRIGIGRGTFARLSFSTLSHPAGVLVAEAPFLGTSIINSYRAEESKTAPGFRILVHPSAARETVPFWCAEIPEPERSEDASHEVDFVTLWPAWIPQDQYPELVSHVQGMRGSAKSQRALRHYDATIAAMARLYEKGKNYPTKAPLGD